MPSLAEKTAHENLKSLIRRKVGGSKDFFKSEKISSKIFAHLSAPFNHRYMFFHTTLGRDIYWGVGMEQRVEEGEWEIVETRAHEGHHMFDWVSLKVLFPVLYSMPHCFAIIPLILYPIFAGLWGLYSLSALLGGLTVGYILPRKPWWFWLWTSLGATACVGLGVWKTGFHSFWLAGAALLLSPLLNFLGASYGRAWLEVRGYMTEICMEYWKNGHVNLERVLNRMERIFTGSAYYFMLPYGFKVKKIFKKKAEKMVDGSLLKEDPWIKDVYLAMREADMCYIEYSKEVLDG